MFEYQVTSAVVIDGDTLWLDIDLGFRIHVQDKFRLAHIDAPELLAFGGMAAKQFVVTELADLIEAKVFTSRREKYGRWLAEFRYRVKREPLVWRDLSSVMLRAGFASKYKRR